MEKERVPGDLEGILVRPIYSGVKKIFSLNP